MQTTRKVGVMKHSLTEILGDFNAGIPTPEKERGAAVTLWIPKEYKESYDKLQAASRREFSKKARAALIALIELAESKAS